jgi:hypothetical protein
MAVVEVGGIPVPCLALAVEVQAGILGLVAETHTAQKAEALHPRPYHPHVKIL